ncbi:GNAT family N-acetyltransferase [Bacillus sp. ISL-51]|uniref:GNAT family N-acetyltransferase n=1 Tax=unclassified Bacillus (in: firmicutes) TaxID=185979 RepID=UPI001BE83F62|nr:MULTISPECIES: GNAT family N-acetyltransferase [unclassified Bacillus (in: firmicutes)]MBT2574069.1 GNAT family N-acetyltransferase [Bacillus sp. ISL-51]MBT2636021.1 GNAT family N-acetyltransferase [Bacillus sp. ISL-26]MBY8913127.1 GNAT family N-acetyltransferase [Bacillus sp. YC2]
MKHHKTYHSSDIQTAAGSLLIEGPVPPEDLAKYEFHEGLTAFRLPHEQHKALIEIAGLPEGRIIIARDGQTIIGYVTYLYPDPLERWSEGNMEDLLELGAIEVAPGFRGCSVGKNLLTVSMMDEQMERYIIMTTEYYWHWDLKGMNKDVWAYRKMMEKMMNAGGLVWFATDEPEISSHPANCLMARIGKHVSQDSIEQFDRLRFYQRFMY